MQRISDEELKLSAIWVPLGMARDSYAAAFRRQEYPDLLEYYRDRVDEMQAVRDEIEEKIERLKDLEALDG
jgi:hypothetical protein